MRLLRIALPHHITKVSLVVSASIYNNYGPCYNSSKIAESLPSSSEMTYSVVNVSMSFLCSNRQRISFLIHETL